MRISKLFIGVVFFSIVLQNLWAQPMTLVTFDDSLTAGDGDGPFRGVENRGTLRDDGNHSNGTSDDAIAPIWFPITLSVLTAGDGSGTVTSTPAGIDCRTDCILDLCGGDCIQIYSDGTSVTLTASPAAGSLFDAYSGACTGSGVCILTMDQSKAVTATFNFESSSLPPPPAEICDAGGSVQIPGASITSGSEFQCQADRIATSADGFVISAGGSAIFEADAVSIAPRFRARETALFRVISPSFPSNQSPLIHPRDLEYQYQTQ